MNNFDLRLRMDMFNAVGFRCGLNPLKEANDAHHIVANNKINRAKWPLYIQSPMTLLPVNNGAHITQSLPKPPSDRVLDVFEEYLQTLTRSRADGRRITRSKE